MKKKYIAPEVKEVKIKIEQQICTGSVFDVDPGATPVNPEDADGKFDFEEWSFDWDE